MKQLCPDCGTPLDYSGYAITHEENGVFDASKTESRAPETTIAASRNDALATVTDRVPQHATMTGGMWGRGQCSRPGFGRPL